MNKKYYLRNVVLSVLFSIAFIMLNYLILNHGAFVVSDLVRSIVEYKSIIVVLVFAAMGIVVSRVGIDTIFKYRYQIAICVFVFCVLLGVTGSSIGIYTEYFGAKDKNILFGISRGIRSDEYAVFTPMTWSQYLDPNGHFSYFNSVARATNTDVFIEYGQPVATWLLLYKPFNLGFLFLPIAKGMAFFWCGRLIALFMVSFEFGRKITDDNRLLSIIYAILIAFSPIVQWWFAINGLVEMLLYLQLSILLLDKYFSSEKWSIKILCAFGIVISAGGFILTMYPAWMLPFAYVILGLGIWLLITKRKSIKKNKKDIILILCSLCFLCISMLYVYHMSKDTISTLGQTVYPGDRVSVGGGRSLDDFFVYTSNFWFPIFNMAMRSNECEMARFISLFPLAYIFYIIYFLKTKKSDLFCNIILSISSVFLIYCTIGFPEWLSKITLLSFSLDKRCFLVVQFCEILVLIRLISLLLKEKVVLNKIMGWVTAFMISILSAGLLYYLNSAYYSTKMLMLQTVLFIFIFAGVFYYDKKRIFKAWGIFFSMFVLLTGILVNPVRVGVDSVEKIPELEMVERVVKADPEAVWISEGTGFTITNSILLKGARTINFTNVYPELNRWKMVDKENKYEDIYNRYAHIGMIYGENDEKFVLTNKDSFEVYVDYDDIKNLNVDFIFSNRDLSAENRFKLVNSTGNYYIYHVE